MFEWGRDKLRQPTKEGGAKRKPTGKGAKRENNFIYTRLDFKLGAFGTVHPKQICQTSITNLRIPTGWRLASWLFTNCGRVEIGTIGDKSAIDREEDLNPGPPYYKSSVLTTRPRLPTIA